MGLSSHHLAAAEDEGAGAVEALEPVQRRRAGVRNQSDAHLENRLASLWVRPASKGELMPH